MLSKVLGRPYVKKKKKVIKTKESFFKVTFVPEPIWMYRIERNCIVKSFSPVKNFTLSLFGSLDSIFKIKCLIKKSSPQKQLHFKILKYSIFSKKLNFFYFTVII